MTIDQINWFLINYKLCKKCGMLFSVHGLKDHEFRELGNKDAFLKCSRECSTTHSLCSVCHPKGILGRIFQLRNRIIKKLIYI